VTELRGEAVVLRPLAPDHAEALRAIRETPEVKEWWMPLEDDFPFGDDPDATRFTIFHEGEIAGLIQYGEETEPSYRHAWIDLFVDPRVRGRGLGPDAIETLVRHLTEDLGHHRMTIDPTLENAAAIRAYEKAGFERVGVMRAAERDWQTGRWRDALLMERVVLPAES
jgi:aminoglycoside 6'-N-acetyltransferase